MALVPSMQTIPLTAVARDDLFNRIRGEYLEMPGLHLTPAQAARLFGLDCDLSRTLLAGLTDAGFLAQTSDGRYLRRE